MTGIYWEIDVGDVRTLTPALRSLLASRYAWADVPAHTHVALVHVREVSPGYTACLTVFPFSCDAQAYAGRLADLEADIDAEARARLRAMRNTLPLTAAVGRRHFL